MKTGIKRESEGNMGGGGAFRLNKGGEGGLPFKNSPEENFRGGRESWSNGWLGWKSVENSHVSQASYRPGEAVSDRQKESYTL